MENKNLEPEFWRKKPLDKLTKPEWEALCAHCGRCCLIKQGCGNFTLFTNLYCSHLNPVNCNCRIYNQRLKCGTCVEVTLQMVKNMPELLPDDCAYKLLVEGKELPSWHPLISGTSASVLQAKKSVSCLPVISESLPEAEKLLRFLFMIQRKK